MVTTIVKRIISIGKNDSLEEAFKIEKKDLNKTHSFQFSGISGEYKKRKYDYYVQFSKGVMVAGEINWSYTIYKGKKREEADLDTRKDKIMGKLKRDMYDLGFKENVIGEIKKESLNLEKTENITLKKYIKELEKTFILDGGSEKLSKEEYKTLLNGKIENFISILGLEDKGTIKEITKKIKEIKEIKEN